MRKSLQMLLLSAALAAGLLSCANGPKVIPRADFKEIYREMFLADQWLERNPSKKGMADTTWFYEAVFQKYGYDSDDYRHSVKHYLSDPERYANLMRKVRDGLQRETDALAAQIAEQARVDSKADSLRDRLNSFRPKDIEVLLNLAEAPFVDSVRMVANSVGVFYLVPVLPDTTYQGPGIVTKEDAAAGGQGGTPGPGTEAEAEDEAAVESIDTKETNIAYDKDSSLIPLHPDVRQAGPERVRRVRPGR